MSKLLKENPNDELYDEDDSSPRDPYIRDGSEDVDGEVLDPMEEILAKSMEVLLDPKVNIDMYSAVSTNMRLIIPKMRVVTDFVGDNYTKGFLDDFLRLGVSENREGRKEMTGILKHVALGAKGLPSALEEFARSKLGK